MTPKTLKDLIRKRHYKGVEHLSRTYGISDEVNGSLCSEIMFFDLDPEELKAEAVKELKLIENGGSINTKRDLSFCKTAVGAYIAWKNNLTEEDLNDP